MKERFLINPVKRRKKKIGAKRKKTSVRRKASKTKTSTRSSVVKKAVTRRKKRTNPKRAVRKRVTKRRVKRKNAIKSKTVVIYRKPKRRKRRRNPALAAIGANPSRRRTRRKRRNPPKMLQIFTKGAPFMVSGAAGMAAVALLPGFLPGGLSENRWLKRGVQLMVAVGGGLGVSKVMKSAEHGRSFTIGGGAAVIYDIVKEFVPGLGDDDYAYGLPDYGENDIGDYELDAYPNYDGVGQAPGAGFEGYDLDGVDFADDEGEGGDDYDEMGAFPL